MGFLHEMLRAAKKTDALVLLGGSLSVVALSSLCLRMLAPRQHPRDLHEGDCSCCSQAGSMKLCKNGVPGRLHYNYTPCAPGVLPVTCKPDGKPIRVLLIHGMWHGSWFWRRLQDVLAAAGFGSYALHLRSGRCQGIGSHLLDIEGTMTEVGKLHGESHLVVIGHSQGGILSQYLVRDAGLAERFAGAVFVGSVPASSLWELIKMMPVAMQSVRDMDIKSIFHGLGFIGSAYYQLTGRLWSSWCMRRIFFLSSSSEPARSTTVTEGGMEEYVQRTVVEASADGFPTHSHYFESAHSFSKIGKKPVLILSAEHDCIYPPATMNPVFLNLFPTASCIVAKGQAHCFADAGWEDSFAGALTGWLSKSFKG